MKLRITHKANHMAEVIIKYLQSKGSIIDIKDDLIGNTVYRTISAQCGYSIQEYAINSFEAIVNSLDNSIIQQVLLTNNLGYDSKSGEVLHREYEVLVFETTTISVKQKIYGKSSTQTDYIDEAKCKKITEFAKRVIYLLGLDYGMVKVAVTGNKKIKVLTVNASPLIREKDIQVLLRKLERLIRMVEDIGSQEVKMGADPEFMMANARNGKMVPASQFFPRDGAVGCDNIRIPCRQIRPVAELRPKPDFSPLQLMANIKQTLYSANTLSPYKNIKWLAGSQPFGGYSIGGHIHFSNVDLNNHILRALDNYVGLPLFLIEDQITAVKRRKKYGFLADYRTKDYGGFEYRTPGSWLVSPEITCAAFCLGKIVTTNYLQLTRNIFINIEAQNAFYEGNQEYLRPLFKDLWADLQNLSMFNSFKEELQFLANMIENKINWDERVDIRRTWNITSFSNKEHKNVNTQINSSVSANNSLLSAGNQNRRSGRSRNRPASSSPVYISSQNFNR
ncbi:MAG: hypothetical protein PHF24_09050 [Syntrophomonas sp.]|nr:hypothetical protein [Syntrophomonas sp.]